MPAPPKTFTDELTRRDPDLRVRWGVHQAVWIIERKMPPRHKQLLAERPTPWKSPRGLDLADGWREGYVHVLTVQKDLLHWALVAPRLDEFDTWKQGGFDAISRQLDEIEAKAEEAADRRIETWANDASSEAYDSLAWSGKRRVDVPVEIRDGYVVSDRRAVSA
jgi:hypothetical protein